METDRRLKALEQEKARLESELTRSLQKINELQSKNSALTNQLMQMDQALKDLATYPLSLAAELDEIKHSVCYKLMTSYASRIDRLLPDNTRRGVLRRILTRSLRILTEQGIRSLFRQALNKLREREFDVLELQPVKVLDGSYALWIQENEPTGKDLTEQKRKAKRFAYRPLISIVTPVWNPPQEILRDTIRSVLSQTYDNWELCIIDGNSNDAIKTVLRKFAIRDRRIRVQFLGQNLGISGNSNIGLEMCRGEFIALLDHDDLLATSALYEVVNCLNHRPDLDFIYSDKDHMTEGGARFNLLFKPDWSPELMLSACYVTHLCVIRTALVRALAGFRRETDGAQDWDLFLRITEKTNRIHHIPKVLYHQRQTATSVSLVGHKAKSYAAEAQLLSLNQHLVRTGREGEMRLGDSGYLRVIWRLSDWPLVSVILYSKDGSEALRRCLHSILNKSTYRNFEVVIILPANSNNGPEETLTEKTSQLNVKFVKALQQCDYSSANNLGASLSKGTVLVFLDARTEVLTPEWLEELTGWAMQSEVGVASPKLVSPDGKIADGGVILGLPEPLFKGSTEKTWTMFGSNEWYRNFNATSGLCLAVRRNVFDEIGRFDEKLDHASGMEFCLRARQRKYRVVWTPHAKLLRLGSIEPVFTEVASIPDYKTIMAKGDEYYNPNLSYHSPIPSFTSGQAGK
jgi:glycosyltransferase involved in cell wall biosynthesis